MKTRSDNFPLSVFSRLQILMIGLLTLHLLVGCSAIEKAYLYDDDDTLFALLVKDAKVKAKNSEGEALMRAVLQNDTNAVFALLKRGADVNAQVVDTYVFIDGYTPLIFAAWRGNKQVVKALLENGADMNLAGKRWGTTALGQAADSGHTEIVKILLENGAEVDRKSGGWTPLALAAYQGHIGTVKFLIESNADIDAALVDMESASKNVYPSISTKGESAVKLLSKLKERRKIASRLPATVAVKPPVFAGEGIRPPQTSAVTSTTQRYSVERHWAVIIGISKYKYSGQSNLTNLIFADDDAKAFARVLTILGWSESHINLLVNEEATKRNIEIALESWLTKAGPSDQIVLFWAGHGFPDPEDPEKVYFACYDTDISIPVTGYRMDKVRTALEERKARNVVLLADTCHAGKLITRGDRGISIVPQVDKMRSEKKVPKGWIFMVGADTDRKAIEHTSWTNGAFTHSLIKGLSGGADGYESVGSKDGAVTMGELRAYLNSAMPDETQRILGVAKRPVITTSAGDPDIWNMTLQVK